ncbi:unnamed protein product [Brassica oleracea]
MPLRHDLRWFVGSFGGGIGFLLGGFVVFCGVVEAQPISGEANGTQLGLDSRGSPLARIPVVYGWLMCS